MKSETRDLLQSFKGFSWFHAVGSPFDEALADDVIAVSSWAQAVKCCSSTAHGNFQLEQKNRLTVYLHDHARDRYRNWNVLVEQVKSVLMPMLDVDLDPLLYHLKLPTDVRDTVNWDLLAACMELEYADIRPPDYFTGIIHWYRSGRFPCGWGGIDDQGRIKLVKIPAHLDPADPDYFWKAVHWPIFSTTLKVQVPEGRLIVY